MKGESSMKNALLGLLAIMSVYLMTLVFKEPHEVKAFVFPQDVNTPPVEIVGVRQRDDSVISAYMVDEVPSNENSVIVNSMTEFQKKAYTRVYVYEDPLRSDGRTILQFLGEMDSGAFIKLSVPVTESSMKSIRRITIRGNIIDLTLGMDYNIMRLLIIPLGITFAFIFVHFCSLILRNVI